MSIKRFAFGAIHQGDVKIRNKAQLEDGSIVEYDRCALAGLNPHFGETDLTKYLGRGTIYEVEGVRQYDILSNRVQYYDFWKVCE